MNYFKLLELPEILPVDQRLLLSHYQRLQNQYHPDRFAVAQEKEKNLALRRSLELNEGFKILKDPLLTAKYYLSLQGFVESQSSFQDMDFLQSQLVLREELDKIEKLLDKSVAIAQLDEFKIHILALRQQHYDELLQQIQQAQWALALNQIQRLYFFEKLLRQIEQDEDNLFDI